MDPLVKQCVDAKKQVFETYFDVPPAVAPELNALFARIDALGEGTNDAAAFEARFQAELQAEYNGMFQKVTPRPVQMTKEEKEASRKLAMELTYGSSDPAAVAAGIAKDVAADAAGYAATEHFRAEKGDDRLRHLRRIHADQQRRGRCPSRGRISFPPVRQEEAGRRTR